MAGQIDLNRIILDLLPVARVALGPSMPQADEKPARIVIPALIALVERTMPADLQASDRRIAAAKAAAELMR